MKAETVPIVYGRALLEAAVDKGILKEVAGEVEAFSKVVAEDPRLRAFFESPRLERSKKKGAVEAALRGRASDIFVNFLLLLLDKGRTQLLVDILAAFRRLHDEHIGLVRAEVVSAVPLGEVALASLKSVMEESLQKRVAFENRVVPEILGGLIVRFDGSIADGSLKTHLEEIRANLLSLKFGSELVHEN
jgi:F-type H+-transporting ATPase subunit delta